MEANEPSSSATSPAQTSSQGVPPESHRASAPVPEPVSVPTSAPEPASAPVQAPESPRASAPESPSAPAPAPEQASAPDLRTVRDELPLASEPNEAAELVGGRPRVVEVSRHPEPSIPETELSLADIERQRSHPWRWVAYVAFVLIAIVVPYGVGRVLALHDTQRVVSAVGMVTPQGTAFVSWTVTLVAFTCLGLAVVDSRRWAWRIAFAVALAAEQLIAGLSLLRFNFWNSTYVVYGDSAEVANAANLGIIASGFAVAAFAVVWVGLLVIIRKDSPLNVLTRSWASFILFFVIQTVALLVVLFGGFLTTA